MSSKDFKLFGIFGYPLAHTLSPAMQEAALRKSRIQGFYVPLEQSQEPFRKILQHLKDCKVEGFNVTVPYKEVTFKALKRVTPEAKAIGAVNTLYKSGQHWCGANTDAFGFLHALKSDGKFNPKGKKVLVLGAGGSARAVVYALAKSGVRTLHIANRTKSRGRALVNRYRRKFRKVQWVLSSVGPRDLSQGIAESHLIVNTTSLGLKPSDRSLISKKMLRNSLTGKKLFFDLIYNPAQTPFLRIAKSSGHRILNGCAMLVGQGAKSFELWTKRKAPYKEMRTALQQALQEGK